MIVRDQNDKAEWLVKHTLTKEQFKQLIQNKMNRATQYHRAVVSKREATASCR